jgi:hypothetical protein
MFVFHDEDRKKETRIKLNIHNTANTLSYFMGNVGQMNNMSKSDPALFFKNLVTAVRAHKSNCK